MMAAVTSFVVDEKDLEPSREDGDTATVRIAFDAANGCERLEQRLIRFVPGRPNAREPRAPPGGLDRPEARSAAGGALRRVRARTAPSGRGDARSGAGDGRVHRARGDLCGREHEPGGPARSLCSRSGGPGGGERRAQGDRSVRRPAGARRLERADLPVPRERGRRVLRRDPVHGHRPAEQGTLPQPQLRRGGIHRLGRGRRARRRPLLPAPGGVLLPPSAGRAALHREQRIRAHADPRGVPSCGQSGESLVSRQQVGSIGVTSGEDRGRHSRRSRMRRRASAIAALLALGAALAIVAGAYATPERAAAPAAQSGSAAASVKCGKTRTIGFMVPATGPAASIGVQQQHWAQYYVSTYNKTHKGTKFRLQTEDTQLGAPTGTAEALKGAQALAGSPNVLGVVGPAGSNEIVGVTKTLMDGGLAWVSGSSTRTTLTTDGTRTGYMFRTVPPDAIQGPTAANYIAKVLKYKRVYIIDDQETYSTGLADAVEGVL